MFINFLIFVDNEIKFKCIYSSGGVVLMSLNLEGLSKKYAVTTGNMGTISAFAWRQENQENLVRDSRSQELPITH